MEDPKEAKCPRCGGLGKATSQIGWYLREYYVKQYECIKCHKKFNTYTEYWKVIGYDHKFF